MPDGHIEGFGEASRDSDRDTVALKHVEHGLGVRPRVDVRLEHGTDELLARPVHGFHVAAKLPKGE